MKKISLTEFFSKIPFVRGRGHGRELWSGRNPARDWRILLGCSLVLILGSFLTHYTVFQDVKAVITPAEEDTPLSPLSLVKKESLDRVITSFKDRENWFEGLKRNLPEIIDPSR